MFGNKIEKTIKIEGMSCMHCGKKVEQALKAIPEIKSVKVDLEEKIAKIILKKEIENMIIEKAVQEAGFEVVE